MITICFPALFLVLCFGSCLIVFGGSLGDTRSEFTANRDGRQRWAEDTIENVKRREKKGNGLTRLLLVGGFRDFKLT